MPALVQTKAKTIDSVTSTTLTFTSNVGLGSLLVAVVGAGNDASSGVWSVTDSLGNSWNAGPKGSSLDDNSNIQIFWVISAFAGGCTVTATSTGSGTIDLLISEYSGISGTPLDQSNSQNESSSTGNITTTSPKELIIAATTGNALAIGAWSASNSFVVQNSIIESSAVSSIAYADLEVTVIGTYSTTFSNAAALGSSAGSAIISFIAGTPPPSIEKTRFGVNVFLQPQPANKIPYRLCVNNNRLHCILPDYTGIFSDFVYYLGRENNTNGYWYRYVIDPAALFSEEDGNLYGGFGDAGVGNLFSLDLANALTFAGSAINIDVIFPFSKNEINQRKDVYHLRFNIDTGNSPLNLTGYTDFGALTSFSLGTITTNGITEVNLLINSTAFNLSKRLALRINGTCNYFKLVDWSIDYDNRPEPLSFLRIATNYGIAAKKRMRTIPIVIDTRGNPVNINVVVDGVAYGNQSFTTNERVTVFYYFNTDVFPTDLIINITAGAGNVFEYYDAPPPVNVEILPVGKLFDQIGPVELERIGALLEFRVRMLATTNTLTYNVYMDDVEVVTAQSLPVTPNVDKIYGPFKMPKGIQGSVCRVEFLSSGGVFYRWNCKLKFTTGGVKSDTKQITIQDKTVGLQS